MGQIEFRGLRCPYCIDQILEAKNEVIRENNRLLRGEFTPEELESKSNDQLHSDLC